MKAYKVQISNDRNSADDGCVFRHFMVFALDFIGAAAQSDDILTELKEALQKAGVPKAAWETVEVDSIELLAVVVGKTGWTLDDGEETPVDPAEWAKKIADRTKKDMNR